MGTQIFPVTTTTTTTTTTTSSLLPYKILLRTELGFWQPEITTRLKMLGCQFTNWLVKFWPDTAKEEKNIRQKHKREKNSKFPTLGVEPASER